MSLRLWPGTSGEVRRYAEIDTSEMRETSLQGAQGVSVDLQSNTRRQKGRTSGRGTSTSAS